MINHFNFSRVAPNRYLVTNDFGRYLYLSSEEFKRLALGEVTRQDSLYQRLHDNLFIFEPVELFSSETAIDLRGMKNYVFSATALHIFVLTTACNLNCVYCQAQDQQNQSKCIMSAGTARKAVDVALQSPAKNLTFEFQGGEPLLNFDVIKEIIGYTEGAKADKNVEFTLVSNLSLLTPEIADFLIEHKVNICTSIDGPDFIHNRNRRSASTTGSYSLMKRGANLLRDRHYPFGGIQTTTRYSLPFAKEIVQEYYQLGAPGMFLRPLTPLGFAAADWALIGYTAEEWLSFYKSAFREVLDINRKGAFFPEQHAVYFLKKILQGHALNYMELRSPCGAGLGQLAYYCDGSIYTCDEARMISESGDQSFRLGNVYEDSYQDIVSSSTCKATCAASITESIPGCCDCVYQPYCGICPVVSYARDGDIFPRAPGGYRCRIYKGMLDYLFSILDDGTNGEAEILRSWVEDEDDENKNE